MYLHGPFAQALPLADLDLCGPIADKALNIIPDAGLLVEGKLNHDGKILAIGSYEELSKSYPEATKVGYPKRSVLLPGLIDCHTHLCWAGSRAQDFALRNSGATYLEMAEAGGGIKYTVSQTRSASDEELAGGIKSRLSQLLLLGITTVECKSGYGLSVEEELRHLRLINKAAQEVVGISMVTTCLAAHVCPPEFAGNPEGYLSTITARLLPALKAEKLTNRIDAFAEPSAFWGDSLDTYLKNAKEMGFELTVHADQFTPGGVSLSVKHGALSADHLEHADEASIAAIANSETVAVALPGASLGLGEPFTPARKLLDAGASVAIASDWNPGSAPMGHVLAQAAIMATYEKLSNAEVLAALTFRAAKALGLNDRGKLAPGLRADVSIWPTDDYREILWKQGSLFPLRISEQV